MIQVADDWWIGMEPILEFYEDGQCITRLYSHKILGEYTYAIVRFHEGTGPDDPESVVIVQNGKAVLYQ